MEHNSPFDSFELQLTNAAQDFLRETAKWAKFLSIVGFIFIGIYVILGLIMIASGAAINSAAPGMGGMAAVSGATIGVAYIIGALIYFFPILYLSKFASKARAALDNRNNEMLADSMENLKSHYKFMGILMIIVLCFVVLALIIGIVAGAALMGM